MGQEVGRRSGPQSLEFALAACGDWEFIGLCKAMQGHHSFILEVWP